MLVIIFGLCLILYVITTYRLKPERFPQLSAEQFDAMCQRRMHNCRRYGALFVIYLLLAIANGLMYTHVPLWLSHIFIAIEVLYLLSAIVWIVWHEMRSRQAVF